MSQNVTPAVILIKFPSFFKGHLFRPFLFFSFFFEDKTVHALNFGINYIMSHWFHLVTACYWWECNPMQLNAACGTLWFITISMIKHPRMFRQLDYSIDWMFRRLFLEEMSVCVILDGPIHCRWGGGVKSLISQRSHCYLLAFFLLRVLWRAGF